MQKKTPPGPSNSGGIADLPLFRTLLAICQKYQEPSFWEVMDSCFISICKFGSFKNPFETITTLPELYFRFRRFILLVQTTKVIVMNHDSSTSSWKPWRRVWLDLILSTRDKYINCNLNPPKKFTSNSKTLSLNISSPHWTSLKWSWRPSQLAWE